MNRYQNQEAEGELGDEVRKLGIYKALLRVPCQVREDGSNGKLGREGESRLKKKVVSAFHR